MLLFCGSVSVEGDSNMNLLRQVLGQAKENGLSVETIISHSHF